MFTYEIIKQKVEPYHGNVVPMHSVPWKPYERKFMEKLEYAKWIEAQKVLFPIGELVTLKHMPIILDRVPTVLYIVEGFQEVHYLADLSIDNEPRAILLKNYDNPTWNMNYAPGNLRKLTNEELALVNLRNSEKKTSGKVIATVNKHGEPIFICEEGDGI